MTAEEKTQLEKLVEKYLKEDAYKPRGWGERAARKFLMVSGFLRTALDQIRRSYLLRLLLLTNQILNYDRRRQKVPCKTRSESQGSCQRGVQTQEPRQERVFQTRSACRQESSGD